MDLWLLVAITRYNDTEKGFCYGSDFNHWMHRKTASVSWKYWSENANNIAKMLKNGLDFIFDRPDLVFENWCNTFTTLPCSRFLNRRGSRKNNRAIGFSDFLFVVHQISRKIGAVIIKFLKKLLKVLMKKMEMNCFFLIIFYVISSGQVVSW